MKLTLKIKLLPTAEQADLLLETIQETNAVCNAISEVAWSKKVFNNFKLHHEVYHPYKATFKLSSQCLIRAIAKVADAYKLDKKTKRTFRPLGSIAYDSRIMTYKPDNIVSLWCIGGRQKIKFVCHNPAYIPYIKGEADLVYKKGKFYLFQTVDVPEEDVEDVEEFIGVDFGINDIISTSDNTKHSADWINQYREKRQKVRSSIQRKGTRNAHKLLKRLSGKERTTSTILNHTISKQIVQSAKKQGKGIAIEDLTNIRFTSKRRNKKFRTKLGRWNFGQLRAFLEYKSLLNGVQLVVVEPAYTSQTCSCCKHIGKRTNKVFKCTNQNCEVDVLDSDYNASLNIASLGRAYVNHAEKSNDMCCSIAHVYSGLKPRCL
ncbi:MAG: transposase [Chitinophagales bacterium]|nr:transposase [Chitinophagales bacterium]